jgi:GDP-4-dehydro-6-deoxy-D-mannose reductase
MQNILITGANGFVGNHLAKELAEHGFNVSGVGGDIGSSDKSPYIAHYQVLDLADKNGAAHLDFRNIDGVIHLAGLAAVGPSFDDPMLYINVNMGIEINLFETALSQNCRPRFLVISSGSLYDPSASMPLSEASPVAPNSPYSVSKLGQEQMAIYYAGRGFETIIARPFNHIGPGQNPGFIAPDLAQQLVEVEKGKSKKISVGNLDATRDYTDVRDIVRAYRLLLKRGVSGEIYNVCSGKAYSGHDILNGLLKPMDIKPKIVNDPERMRPADIAAIYGNHDKLTKHTGWKPSISIDDTLRDVVNDWRSRS